MLTNRKNRGDFCAKLYLLLGVALFVVSVPEGLRAQNGRLAGLDEVNILVEDLPSSTKRLGLTEQSIKDQVLVLLRSKLPRLSVVNNSSTIFAPYVYIQVNLRIGKTVGGKEVDFYGSVQVDINRYVTINRTGKRTYGTIWNGSSTLTGPMNGSAVNDVRDTLDDLLTKFAADWYRDNPTN